MKSYDIEKAKESFAAKAAFSTGLHEVDGPSAINLPNGQWHKATGLSREKANVVYCYSQTCHLAAQSAVEFARQGYPVVEMEGGFEGWKASGYAIENGQVTQTTQAR